jgi:hypothetical protein
MVTLAMAGAEMKVVAANAAARKCRFIVFPLGFDNDLDGSGIMFTYDWPSYWRDDLLPRGG